MTNQRASILIVTGEASADRYAARVVERLRERTGSCPVRFVGTGGDFLEKAGMELVAHVRDLASIGPHEAISQMRKYVTTYRALVREAVERTPAVALLLDFPEFNLRLAARLKGAGIPVVYYIGPQIWAWRRYRIRAVRAFVDRMLVILPFEESFYRQHGVSAEFVGHPLLEDFHPRQDRRAFLCGLGLDPERTTVALMPGSRRKEVDHILPSLVGAAAEVRRDCDAQFVLSVAPTIPAEYIRKLVSATGTAPGLLPHLRVAEADSHDILASSDFAMVKSGTSTLEAALAGTPHLVTYRISPISWLAGKILIRSRFKGLANLIAGERIVPELLQGEATSLRLAATTLEYLREPEKMKNMKARLLGIRTRLGERKASVAVAETLCGFLR